jgi:hypothetical protein
MYSIYGRRVLDLDESVLKAIYEETSHFSEAMAQIHTVDQYPVLERLPKVAANVGGLPSEGSGTLDGSME